MAKRTQKRVNQSQELDSVFLLKLIMYIIVGSIWIKIDRHGTQIPIPIGFLIGLAFTTHEHFKMDRKIEYAVLLVAMLIGFWAPLGLFITMY